MRTSLALPVFLFVALPCCAILSGCSLFDKEVSITNKVIYEDKKSHDEFCEKLRTGQMQGTGDTVIIDIITGRIIKRYPHGQGVPANIKPIDLSGC